MRVDTAATGQFRIRLPPELTAELRRPQLGAGSPLAVEWNPTLWDRLFGLFVRRPRAGSN
jgi:hypothetical protein